MRIPVPFLGGPISAILLFLAFAPNGNPVLGWFALVPLFHSLQRHRENARMRFAHGFFFGLILAATSLSWLLDVFTEDFPPSFSPELGGILHAFTCWTGISLYFGVFALAAGPLLRSPRVFTPLVTLPILWTGLEILRGPLLPIPTAWVTNWLTLGYTLSPQAAEAQPAAVLGVYGLSLAMAASSTAFSLVLGERSLWRQLLLGLLGCALPLACHLYGRLVLPEQGPEGTVEVAVAAQERTELKNLIDLTLRMENQRPDLIVWPSSPVVSIDRTADEASGEPHVSPGLFRDFLQRGQSVFIVGARMNHTEDGLPDEQPRHPRPGDRCVAVVGAEGDVIGALCSETGGASRGSHRHPTQPFDCPRGRVGLGLGFDFDVPSKARILSSRGAELLVSVTEGGALWGSGAERRTAMQRFRALENRRWLVYSSGTHAFIADPFGRPAFHLRDVEGIGGHGVESLQEHSLYTRYGWWIEPVCLSGAGWILLRALVGRLRRPRRTR